MFIVINDISYNKLELTAYRTLANKEHPIGLEIHYAGGTKIFKDFETEAERTEFISQLGDTYVVINNISYNAMYFTAYYKEDIVTPDPSYNVIMHYGGYSGGATKLVKKFDNEDERDAFVEQLDGISSGGGLIQKDSYTDFPTTGSGGCIYIAKDTGQTYYWDTESKSYVKTGTAGKSGIYSTDKPLSPGLGSTTNLNKSDLSEIIKPTVPYSDGSEVIGGNTVHGMIVSTSGNTVTVKTITDLTIDSFQQVTTEADLPNVGTPNILYYVKELKDFRIWNGTAYEAINKVDSITGEDEELVDNTDPKNPIILHDIKKIDKSIIDGSNLEYKTVVSKVENTVVIEKTIVNVEDETETKEKTVLKSNGTINIELNEKSETEKEIIITTKGDTNIIQNAFTFDGVKVEFELPAEVDLDKAIMISVNGVVLSEGTDKDYVITDRKIKFALAFEADSNNIILN